MIDVGYAARVDAPEAPQDPSRPSAPLVAAPGREADLDRANRALAVLVRLCPKRAEVLATEVRRALIIDGVARADR